MTHPALATMVEAAERNEKASPVARDMARVEYAVATQPANILSLAEYVKGLEEALAKLRSEVVGLAIAEDSVREAIGNTNWNVLMLRADEAAAALGGKP